jgi:hypothetical protein
VRAPNRQLPEARWHPGGRCQLGTRINVPHLMASYSARHERYEAPGGRSVRNGKRILLLGRGGARQRQSRHHWVEDIAAAVLPVQWSHKL